MTLKNQCRQASKGGEALIHFLKEVLSLGVLAENKSGARYHPLIYLNSIKNILSDCRQNPSPVLLESCLKVLENYPSRIPEEILKTKLESAIPDRPVFVMDLLEAIQVGDTEKIWMEAAALKSASQNQYGLLEILAEAGLRNIPEITLFVFHLLRAYVFVDNPALSWPFSSCLIMEIIKNESKPGSESFNGKPEDILDHIIREKDMIQIQNFAAVNRLLDFDYIRQGNMRAAFSACLGRIQTNTDDTIFPGNEIRGLNSYQKTGGTIIMEIAEEIIQKYENDLRALYNKISQLDACRYLIKISSQKQLPYIGRQIERLR